MFDWIVNRKGIYRIKNMKMWMKENNKKKWLKKYEENKDVEEETNQTWGIT